MGLSTIVCYLIGNDPPFPVMIIVDFIVSSLANSFLLYVEDIVLETILYQ
jgi:hypothetical protein